MTLLADFLEHFVPDIIQIRRGGQRIRVRDPTQCFCPVRELRSDQGAIQCGLKLTRHGAGKTKHFTKLTLRRRQLRFQRVNPALIGGKPTFNAARFSFSSPKLSAGFIQKCRLL